jgi:6,7-dimethyl-8-ribityllumazine synthase
MSEPERRTRMPQDTPEWTGGEPVDDWPARPEARSGAEQPADEAAEEAEERREPAAEPFEDEPSEEAAVDEPSAESPDDADELEAEDDEEPEPELPPAPDEELEDEPEDDDELAERAAAEHAAGEIDVPDGYAVIEGYPSGHRRHVGIVVGRFNGEITNRLLAEALQELETAGVARDAVTVMPVPGAFELPLAAMALAKTRRYSCIVTLGCVIRGETPHFEYVAGEAASGIQLAAIETGVPVAFGVLTCDTVEQAEARTSKGAEAVRTALEMADVFGQVRAKARA